MKNLFTKIILLLCLVTAGVQGAWALDPDFWGKDVGYYVYTSDGVEVVAVVAYRGKAETLTIPAYITNGSKTYQVECVKFYGTEDPIDISTVKTLIFEGGISLRTSHREVTRTFDCPNLRDIFFKGGLPMLSGEYADYFGNNGEITAHVTGRSAEEIAEMNYATVWCDFYAIVPYYEAESEPVNVYVTVEEDSPGQGVMFQIDGDRYIYGSGSKLFQTMMHSDLSFYVADGSKATPKQVLVNGRDVLPLMEVPETNPFYDSANPKMYTISNVSGDTYIRVTAEDLVDPYRVSAGQGGCVKFDFNGEQQTVEGGNLQSFSLAKGQSLSLTIRPDEGFVFDRFWCDGIDMTEYMTFTKQIDGSLATTVEGGGQYLATFKPVPRQLFGRYGGDGNVVFTRKRGGVTNTYNILANKPVSVPLPAWEEGDEIMLSIEVHADEKVRVTRNGMGVTGMFIVSPATGDRTYTFEADDPESTELYLESGDINVWDEATWMITIEKAYKIINAYTNNDALVTFVRPDGSAIAKENSQHAMIYEGETYTVKFLPRHGEELKGFEIGWSPIDIENESRLVKNEDGSYSFTAKYDEIPGDAIDLVGVFERSSAAGRVFFVTTTGTDYVDVTRSNGSRISFNGRGTMKKFDLLENEYDFEVKPFTNFDEVEKVLLNGEDVTNDSRYFRETGSTTPAGSYVKYDFGSVKGNSIIQIVYKNSQYDTNVDGRVDITDVTKVVNKILEQ